MTKLNFAGLSNPGAIRSTNQDAYYIDPNGRFFIVADGDADKEEYLGGAAASRITIETIQAYLHAEWESNQPENDLLEGAFSAANGAISWDQQEHPEYMGAKASALVVIFPASGQPWCAHAGSSRLYHIHDGKELNQVTEDDTWVARAIKMGDITREEAMTHPWRHVMYNQLGHDSRVIVHTQPLDLSPNDILLLCTDGLTEEVPEERIDGILRENSLVEKAAAALVKTAIESGGSDNITVVCISVVEC